MAAATAAMAAPAAEADFFEMTEVPGDENLPVEDLSDDELEDVGGGQAIPTFKPLNPFG